MRDRTGPRRVAALALAAATTVFAPGFAQENIDPDDDGSQYAWSENAGWISAEQDTDEDGVADHGVEVRDFDLLGWMWSENLGWISLTCRNTGDCAIDYGVRNDGHGNLSGLAWSENAGWIRFAHEYGGVAIDPGTGVFHGEAWGENIGWVRFHPVDSDAYRMVTAWHCEPPPPTPPGIVSLRVEGERPAFALAWPALDGATGYDAVVGDVQRLRATGGDFAQATDECVAHHHTTTVLPFLGDPPPQTGWWALVRGVNCGGPGTYDSAGPSQLRGRDDGIAASPGACP